MKICGLTVPEEAAACAAAGAWAIGIVLWEGSRRCVAPERAREIVAALPRKVHSVGLFVDAEPDAVARVARSCGFSHVQVHGAMDPAAARAASGCTVIESIRVTGPEALERARESAADLVLLDGASGGRHGGTGSAFDWSLLEDRPFERPFALAGGLRPENVAEAVRRTRPHVVDVSSGVERAPGRKDLALVRSFVANARTAEPVSAASA